jgi:hypothetical protein
MPDTEASAHDDIALSRSAGLLSMNGNADSELKTRVSDEAADDFRRLARELGMNTSELLRVCVLTRLYGVDGVARMTATHLARAVGIGTANAQPRRAIGAIAESSDQ